jgi:hypothetical protein
VSLSGEDIRKEMDGWRRFAEALRAEDRDLFREMMRLCYEYVPAMEARDSPFPTEALFMSLLLMQHKTIAWLMKEVERLKAARDERLDT